MRSVRNGLRVAAIGVSVIAASAFVTGTASAHTLYAYQGSDRAWSDHSHLRVEDRECDAHGVYAEGYDAYGYLFVEDTNGCSSGYSHADGLNIYQFRVCERSVGCSPWVYD